MTTRCKQSGVRRMENSDPLISFTERFGQCESFWMPDAQNRALKKRRRSGA
ncbi:hypothetical protein HMP0721_2279 [Pseudoramibacter alactolyticus ATCC 23263]|uniref:Uncharacterized protein n=1 Tax=Pseudoramibacter alactolyticus ATCC 23263 TaxID=887929 RepID=E6MJU4_9FIRM|nr:hypothetical protein HMP0721_2279 [Pseudoramibacter alactolyticus ATCC 23263]